MLTTSEIRTIYEKIQKQLFYMIPEKWDRVYLYASVLDHHNNVQTGEMFFYYYPKSMLRKNPVNVYEVPNKFNIDEQAYLKLAEKLYKEIKRLRTYLIKMGEEPWSNLTIRIKDFKFNIDYSYEDLVDSSYTSYDRHLIWRYKYLNVPLSSYSKKDRKMLEKYLEKEAYYTQNISTYSEGLYRVPVSNIIDYNHVSADNKANNEQQYMRRKRVNIEDTDILPVQKVNKKPKDYLVADSIKMPEQMDYEIKNPVMNKENEYRKVNTTIPEEHIAVTVPADQKVYKVANTVFAETNYNDDYKIINTINNPKQYVNEVTLQDKIEEIKPTKQYINTVTWYDEVEDEEIEPVKQYINTVTWYDEVEDEEIEPAKQYINTVTWYNSDEDNEDVEQDKQYINTVTIQNDIEEDFTSYEQFENENIEIEEVNGNPTNQILRF